MNNKKKKMPLKHTHKWNGQPVEGCARCEWLFHNPLMTMAVVEIQKKLEENGDNMDLTITDLMKKLGICRATFYYYCRRMNINPNRYKRYHTPERQKAVYSKGDFLSLRDQERSYIISVLTHCKGNITWACTILKSSRTTIYRRIKEGGIDVEALRFDLTLSAPK